MTPSQLIDWYKMTGMWFIGNESHFIPDMEHLVKMCELKLHIRLFSLKKTMDAQMDYLNDTYKTK